ncbi:MAG: beta-N-acetylhexosaminidase [Akkermansiaceae bacterium]|nr:beta-N-acetylhexosaminidase [Akkermansiaceae bacterium]
MPTSIQSLAGQLPALLRTFGFAAVPMPLLRLALLSLAMAVVPARAADLPALIPMPVSVTLTGGQFTITPATKVLHTKGDARLADAAAYLAQRLSQAFDRNIVAEATEATEAPSGAILMTTAGADAALGDEGYALAVTAQGAVIRAPQAAGAFYAGITLLQLAPAAAFRGQALVEDKLGGVLTKPAPRPCDEPNISSAKPVESLAVPCATITDQPRFAWRGLLIDMARHFWTIEELKAYVDYLAIHKLNSLQLHLTDYQNWCIEIMKFPSLTPEKALNAADPQRLANQTYDALARHYYTQEELRGLVSYAAKRFVNIVPEIEMPGHCGALMQAGLNVGCTIDGKQAGGGEVCPGDDHTYVVLQHILDEVLAVFPSKYIHIGADECGKGNWGKCTECRKRMQDEGLKSTTELHGYFVGRMSDYLQQKSRTLVGWDEILESGAKTGAIGMYWRSGQADKLIANASQNGQHLVMTPTAHCYFDFVQAPNKQSEPEGFGGNVITLKTAYQLNPIPTEVAKVDPKLSLGVQANLWGERMKTFPHVLYMTYPRACALAEVAWSPDGPRDYAGFFQRVKTQLKRLDAAGINYRQPTVIDQPE